MPSTNYGQCEKGYVKEYIDRSIKDVLSLLYAGNLRNFYFYFKIDRVEHILEFTGSRYQIHTVCFNVVPLV